MNEQKDEKKIEIKQSLLIGLIVFALILLITVVFLFGFLIGSAKNKQTIVTKIDEFTIGNSSGNKENVTISSHREQENKKEHNINTSNKKEDTHEDSNKNIGFLPFGSQNSNQNSNQSSKSNSSENENKDTRNLSALFSNQNEDNSNNYKSSSSNQVSSSQITASSQSSSSTNTNYSSDSGKEAVKNYFMELELKLAGSKSWTDPNQFAEQLLKSAMSGDFSDLNDLTGNMRKVANDVANMSVPAECAEHRDSVVASLNDSIRILEKVRRGIEEGDMQIIMSLTAEAESIKSSAQRSDELMKQLKSKYGI